MLCLRPYLIVLLLLLLIPLKGEAQEPAPPHSREEWVSRLRDLPDPLGRDDYLFLNQFQALDARTVFQLIQENWTAIKSDHGRCHLVQYTAFESHNPYLLSILHLGRKDPAPRVRQMAIRCLRLVTFRDLSDETTYESWYREEASLPLSFVIQNGCRCYTRELESANESERVRLLERFQEIPFGVQERRETSQREQGQSGLMQLRREAVSASGLLALLWKYLEASPSPTLRQKALVCIAHYQPESRLLASHEPTLRREIPALLSGSDASLQEKLELLANIRAEWTVAPLSRLVQEEYGETNTTTLIHALVKSESLKVAPLLIVMLEIAEAEQNEEECDSLHKGLKQLTGQTAREAGSQEWRHWWSNSLNHKPSDKLPQEFPRLTLRTRGKQQILRHIVCPIYSPESRQPTYWHISSGFVWDTTREQRRLGLLVVLFDPAQNSRTETAQRWQEALATALQGGYVVALVPTSTEERRGQNTQKIRWTVEDLCKTLPIDPRRTWLMAEGKQAESLYASAVAHPSLFRGYWLVETPFQKVWLPPQTSLQKNRFLLQFTSARKEFSPLLPLVAQAALREKGASVRLLPSGTNLPLHESLKEAIHWFEITKGF